jgi:adenylate cyclase
VDWLLPQQEGGDQPEAPDEAWIDFRGPEGTFETFPLSRLLSGEIPPGSLRGKTVVVGTAAPSIPDPVETPIDDAVLPGVEYQANAIQTVRDGYPIEDPPPWASYLALLLLALLPAALFRRFNPLWAWPLALGLGGLYLVVAQAAFNAGWILPVVAPLAGLAVTTVGGLSTSYVIATLERQRARDTFARFISPAVVDQLLDGPGGLELGGLRAEVTVMFSDIRGFTTFSASRSPEAVVDVLNRYLDEMAGAILANGGTIASFIGDGIMAVFGAPIEQEDHADRALSAAREMLEIRLPAVNEWLAANDLEPFEIGIGLNSGPVLAGMVGSEERLDYTAIGDTVNAASRLEGMTKDTPHSLLLSDSTREALVRTPPSEVEFVDELEIRGRSEAIAVWGLAGAADPRR